MQLGWFPDDPYRAQASAPPVGGHRPINQGDVFTNVPVAFGVKAVEPRRTGGDETYRAKAGRNDVIVVTHPCACRKGSSGELNPLVSVAPVNRVSSLAQGWGPPWEGQYRLFPLPKLVEGKDYAADLSRLATARSEYLADNRIAVLNLAGSAAFAARVAHSLSRVEPDMELHLKRAEDYACEFDLWEMWVAARETEDGFQQWLDGPHPSRDGASRRDGLKLDFEEIRDELSTELSSASSD